MNANISQAIAEQRLLICSYKGEARTVEAHTYGRMKDGRDALCGWQTASVSGYDFRLYFIDDMSEIALESDTFADPRSGYKRGESRFSYIYAEL